MAVALTCRVAPQDPALLECTERIARDTDLPSRPLQLQALLQLPRLADERGIIPVSVVEALVGELAKELPAKPEWSVRGAASSPRQLHFHEVDGARSQDVMKRLHYLRSPRMDGRAYGLSTDDGCLVALCVSSPLDVPRLCEMLVAHYRSMPLGARVVSRVFAFEGAPTNSISYLLSRAARAERRQGVTDFVTYVNPNMGFTGASYRASGWQLLGDEPGTTYRYIDGRYTTDRNLAAEFGRQNDGTYRRLLGARFAVSTMPLAPLLVFHYRVSGHVEKLESCRPSRSKAGQPQPVLDSGT